MKPSAAHELTIHETDAETLKAIKMFVKSIPEQYDVAEVILFGSRARQTHHAESDADVAVLLRGEHQELFQTTLAMSDIAFDVLLETGINISPLPIWIDEWEHPETYSNPHLLQNIANEGVRL